MNIKYVCTLITVRDVEKSKKFYCELLNMNVTADFGANVTLDDAFALQTYDTWKAFIETDDEGITLGHCAGEMYFETDDFDAFADRLKATEGIEYIHNVKEHDWGQRVVRFFDPDKNIIEVGEGLNKVAKRFEHEGMNCKQIAARMGVPEGLVCRFLAQ